MAVAGANNDPDDCAKSLTIVPKSSVTHKPLQNTLKRLLDLTGAGLGLLVLSPVFAAIAALIKLDSPGPVFFRQERVGRHGQPFWIFKFRSMRTDAPSLGGQLTVGRDPRITRVGALLRQTKLDELPQLLNVLRGEMSLVGPRPEVPKYVALYTPEQRQVLAVRPGITDLASIEYRSESELLARAPDPEKVYVQEVMPHKLQLNLEYIRTQSLDRDLAIIFKTIRRVVRPR
ncbi:MAG: sugar transferase [Truepera sp.]|nr:sugar transferase [Truepera sp.]